MIVIHSCGGFGLDEKFSVLTIEKVLKNKKDSAKVIVSGCLPKINEKILSPFQEAIITPTENLSILDSLIEAKIPYNSIADNPPIGTINDLYHGTIIQRIKRNLKLLQNPFTWYGFIRKRQITKADSFFSDEVYKITIAHGCLSNCSYCAIKFAMPKFSSVDSDKVVEQFQHGLKQNYKYFALTGADIGAYGMDIGSSLAKLLERIFTFEGDYEINLVDLNGKWFVKKCDELLAVLEKNSTKVNKIIIPVQSGSNNILKLMKRGYTIEEINRCLSKFQKRVPAIKLETHILVGFPGESEEDFQRSYEFLKSNNLSLVQIYRYQDRPNTVASKMSNKIPESIINQRAKTLMQLGSNVICN